MATTENVRPEEINKFGALAERWWDPKGEFNTLHAVNPLRTAFIQKYTNIANQQILDVGCGGGILSEALAKLDGQVVGIDLSKDLVEIANLHSLKSKLKIDYQKVSAEALVENSPESFDCITCMEMLEHVPKPASVIDACARLVKPGGTVFFSTLNRQWKAWLLAIVGAEYLMRMIPKGTHDYKTFIKPSELTHWARQAGLEIQAITGIEYNPLIKRFRLGEDIDVNYIAVYKKPQA